MQTNWLFSSCQPVDVVHYVVSVMTCCLCSVFCSQSLFSKCCNESAINSLFLNVLWRAVPQGSSDPFKAVKLSVDNMKFTRSLHGLPWLVVEVLSLVSACTSGLA